MKLILDALSSLSASIQAERKAQGLSREQAAAVCNVSTSFIRDAESDPARCSFGKLLALLQGLGLSVAVNGWSRAQDTAQRVAVPSIGAPSASESDAS